MSHPRRPADRGFAGSGTITSGSADETQASTDAPRAHWMDYDVETTGQLSTITFDPTDIGMTPPNAVHIDSLIKKRFGPQTTKIQDDVCRKQMHHKHEFYRKRATKDSAPEIKRVFLSLARLAGLGKFPPFALQMIQEFASNNPTFDGWLTLFFVMRGAWDEYPSWMVSLECGLMAQRCWEHRHGFKTRLNKMGWVARIVTKEKTRKLREINLNIVKRTNYSIAVTMNTKECPGIRRRPLVFDIKKMAQCKPTGAPMGWEFRAGERDKPPKLLSNDTRMSALLQKASTVFTFKFFVLLSGNNIEIKVPCRVLADTLVTIRKEVVKMNEVEADCVSLEETLTMGSFADNGCTSLVETAVTVASNTGAAMVDTVVYEDPTPLPEDITEKRVRCDSTETAGQQVQGESAKHDKGLNIMAGNGVEATVESVQRAANKATQELQATVEKERVCREQNERNLAIAKVRDVSTWHKSNVVD